MGFEKIHNKKQCEIINLSIKHKPEILFLDGAFGSGKTYICITLFLNHVLSFKNKNYKFIMTGHTLGSLKRNVLDPIHEIYGFDTTVSSQDNSFKIYGNKICCFGTDKENSYEAIRGVMTAYGHYANELTLSKQSAIKEVFGRMRGERARFFWEMNPADPNHWLYKTYIERNEREGNNDKLVRVSTSMYDNDIEHNGYLPGSYIRRMEQDYTGIWAKKYIMGEWAALEGQIYFIENLQYYDESILDEQNWFIGTIINGYLDPATGSQKKTGCYTSAITGALKDDKIYILDAVVKKIMPNEINGAVSELISKRNYSVFAVEDNFSQDGYVVQPLKKMHPFVNIQGMSSREDKLSRLIGMHNTVSTKVFFPQSWMHERNSDGWLLLQQLCNITKNRTERAESDEQMLDAPDALEGLIRTFRTAEAQRGRMATSGGSALVNNADWKW